MEEALVVHSLFHEDTLSQIEIATLLGRHKSWVCRRIALIDRLCDEGTRIAQPSSRLTVNLSTFDCAYPSENQNGLNQNRGKVITINSTET